MKANWPYCEQADHPPPADWLEVDLPRSNSLTIPHSPNSAPCWLKLIAVLVKSTLWVVEHDDMTSAVTERKRKEIFIIPEVAIKRHLRLSLFPIQKKTLPNQITLQSQNHTTLEEF